MDDDRSFDYRARFDLRDHVALVIGSGAGIGQAGAESLAAAGAPVVVADIKRAVAEGVAAKIVAVGGAATAALLNVRDTAAQGSLVNQVDAEHGRLDTVLSTPAGNPRKPLTACADGAFDRAVELKLKGMFRVARVAARGMSKLGRARGNGGACRLSGIGCQQLPDRDHPLCRRWLDRHRWAL